MKTIFQLTMVSQNDDGCSCGTELSAKVTGITGGTLRKDSEPLHAIVWLPVPPPPGHEGPPSPTWFLELNTDIGSASFVVEISGPCIPTTTIRIPGSQMQTWVDQNNIEKTNQIYLDGSCGIFGYAQLNTVEDEGTYWIYTITGGVTNPVVHPSDMKENAFLRER